MKDKIKSIITNKWFINSSILVLFLLVLILSSMVRLQNLPLLVDQTTGEYLPLALDPFYFLRVSETIVNDGELPAFDSMRYPQLKLPYINEVLPQVVVFMYRSIHLFNEDISLQFVNVISPVILFILGMIVFFFLAYNLTNSKVAALISSSLLAFTQSYLYRTMAGFSDHEALGMFVFFTTMLVYSYALKYLEKGNLNYLKTTIFATVTSFLTLFMMVSWGGGSSFVTIIIPLSFIIIWLIKFKYSEESLKNPIKHYFTFYSLWVAFIVLMGTIFNYSPLTILNKFTSSFGLIVLFVLGFILCDLIMYFKLINEKLKKYRVLISTIGASLIGIILILIAGRNILSIVLGLLGAFIKPFGTERITLTVMENSQPFLTDWISQLGRYFFWIAFIGFLFIGIELGRKIISKKKKVTFSIAWIMLIICILCSRIDPTSVLNGESFMSSFIYFAGGISFIIACIWVYFKEEDNISNKINLDSQLVLFASLILLIIVSVRSASRVFFFIVPFTCLTVGYLIVKLKQYHKDSNDEFIKITLLISVIIATIIMISILFSSFQIINNQSKYTGPSANIQWQQAMSWVRTNTDTNSIFVHWWDYGYWVQYLGERATITDGGHGNDFWDHLIGRYLLTTPNPTTAMVFMNSQDVDYLLIDKTDLGKYPAYSKIGSNEEYDRFSIITSGLINNQQTVETKDIITRIYNIGGVVDQDIVYNELLLPGPSYDDIGNPTFNSYIVGIITEESNGLFKQPQGVFVYNNKQTRIPLRYLYYDGSLVDFEEGIESIAYIIPSISSEQGSTLGIDKIGAMIYLSPKVSKSLFAQLYLFNNIFNNYPTITIAHSEPDPFVNMIKQQGIDVGEFIYYQEVKGPIKIFKVNYPDNFPKREEFIRTSGDYAEFDYLFK